ncbi:helix-turn-helix protein [Bosea sp. 124]|nr:helix-turn-helix transcriptional regulator [Bosea sp. 124]PTM41619.1 helix-turn-helix protein [Bosea sp. 124]
MVNRFQVCAARGWLGISQQELADLSGVAKRTIAHLETGDRIPHDRTLRDIQQALESRGVEFVFENGRGIGLRVHSPDWMDLRK